MAERDYTNDYDAWLTDNPYEYQGKPEPPGGMLAPVSTSPTGGPPYTTANPPPAPPDGYEYVLNPNTGEFELRPRNVPPPPPDNNTTTTDPPPPTTTYTGDGGDGGDGGEFDGSGFQWPSYTAPAYQSPGAFTPRRDTFSYTPFSYHDFAAPTPKQARENPGYKFAAEEGINRLENSAAGRGVLRSGGTLKDIIGWGNKFADQNYDQVFNRDLTTYGTNRNNAFDAYRTNLDTEWNKFNSEYGIDRDVYDRLANDVQSGNTYRFGASQAEFAPKFDAAKLTFADLYNRWRDKLNAATQIATGGPQ